MTFSGILPLLIMIALIIAISYASRKISDFNMKVSGKITKWFLIVYGLIILVGTILLFLYPIEKHNFDQMDTKVIQETDTDIFVNEAKKGNLDKLEGVVKNGEWEFPLTNTQIRIQPLPHHYLIVVEKTDELENTVEVFYYENRTIVDGVDVTNLQTTPNVRWKDNSLAVLNDIQVRVNLAKMEREFTVNQFVSNYGSGFEETRMTSWGQGLFYIKVPKGTNIQSDEFIDYVSK